VFKLLIIDVISIFHKSVSNFSISNFSLAVFASNVSLAIFASSLAFFSSNSCFSFLFFSSNSFLESSAVSKFFAIFSSLSTTSSQIEIKSCHSSSSPHLKPGIAFKIFLSCNSFIKLVNFFSSPD
jgi:hypothetical protein